MSPAEEEKLLDLQAAFLHLPSVAFLLERRGEGWPIAGEGSPTLADVRGRPLPEWRAWFEDYLGLTREGCRD